MIPFFVVDRPMSLNILKVSFARHPHLRLGLMTHACVTRNFLNLFAQFPCQPGACWLRNRRECGRGCSLRDGLCALGASLQRSIVRMCDSGIFEKSGKRLKYDELFAIYEQSHAEYGVMQDVLHDSKRTLLSAHNALREYRRERRSFKLVLVAQGKSVEEYLSCYEQLLAAGGEYIAVGGLLRRRERSARYMYVSDAIARQVLSAINKEFSPRWLFALGAYHASRHELFESQGVFGSDYKGWIFNYEHRRDRITRIHAFLSRIEQETEGCQTLRKISRQRDKLGRIAHELRLGYITTRNSSQRNSIRKALLRDQLQDANARLARTDLVLLAKRQDIAAKNGLSMEYKKAVSEFLAVLGKSDQEIRIQGVHKYLIEKVYSQLRGTQGLWR
jgi:hypothetical protein